MVRRTLRCGTQLVQVVAIGSQKGLIVAMDDRGQLSVAYLGTWPEGSAVAGDTVRPVLTTGCSSQHVPSSRGQPLQPLTGAMPHRHGMARRCRGHPGA